MKYLVSVLSLLVAISSQAQQGTQPPAIPVVIDIVKQTEVVPTMPITGNVYSQNDIQITAAITGQLEFVAEPGTALELGDVIMKMDTAALKLQQAEQQALIKRAQAQLTYLESNLKRQQDLVKAQTISAPQAGLQLISNFNSLVTSKP